MKYTIQEASDILSKMVLPLGMKLFELVEVTMGDMTKYTVERKINGEVIGQYNLCMFWGYSLELNWQANHWVARPLNQNQLPYYYGTLYISYRQKTKEGFEEVWWNFFKIARKDMVWKGEVYPGIEYNSSFDRMKLYFTQSLGKTDDGFRYVFSQHLIAGKVFGAGIKAVHNSRIDFICMKEKELESKNLNMGKYGFYLATIPKGQQQELPLPKEQPKGKSQAELELEALME